MTADEKTKRQFREPECDGDENAFKVKLKRVVHAAKPPPADISDNW